VGCTSRKLPIFEEKITIVFVNMDNYGNIPKKHFSKNDTFSWIKRIVYIVFNSGF